jgi:hypothetical protein
MPQQDSAPPYVRARQLLRRSGYRCRWESRIGKLNLACWFSRSRRGTLLLQQDENGDITLFTHSGVPTDWNALQSWLATPSA